MARRVWFVPTLITVFVLLCAAYATLLGARARSGEHDFLAFYVGAKLAPTGDLYDLPAQFQLQRETVGREYRSIPWIRFPYYAALLRPLGWAPFGWAWPIWAILQGLCACWILWLFGRTDLEFFCIMMLVPALYTSTMGGQDTLLFAVMVIAVWMLLERGKDAAAGGLLALALIKPHFAAGFALVLLVRGRWKALWSFAGSSLILFLASAAIAGIDWPLKWLQTIRPEVLTPNRSVMPNALNLLETIVPGSRIAWPVLVVLLAALMAWTAYRSPNLGKAFACAAITGVLIAPHAYLQDLVLLVPAFAWLGLDPRWQSARLALIPAAVVLPLLLQLGRPYSAATAIGLLAAMLVVGLSVLRQGQRHGDEARRQSGAAASALTTTL